jgi:glycosyltransferase involved in cell wall biosynthesis
MRILTFSTLYPNDAAPAHGVFVENRLRHLVETGAASALVLAPVPYFPSKNPVFGAWSRHAAVPTTERRHGIEVLHPRYIAIPRFGMSAAPFLLYASAARALARLRRSGEKFDLIDAHYLYPDGVAATWLGRRFALPVVLTARGSDVTQWPEHALPRRLIRNACANADAIITVSAGLCDALASLGVGADRINVLRNGVDLTQFLPADRAAARSALGSTGPTLLSVGSLIRRKGHDLTVAALAHLPEWRLLIAGEGPERSALLALASRLGVSHRVRLLGQWPHDNLAALYSAADISVLASAREGLANVLLESMACGTPVVASPIAGNDEAVQSPDAGLIAGARTSVAIADAVRRLFANMPDRAATRAYAARFGWEPVSRGQLEIFTRILESRRHTGVGP